MKLFSQRGRRKKGRGRRQRRKKRNGKGRGSSLLTPSLLLLSLNPLPFWRLLRRLQIVLFYHLYTLNISRSASLVGKFLKFFNKGLESIAQETSCMWWQRMILLTDSNNRISITKDLCDEKLCQWAICMMASFYYYDQNPFRFYFHL